MSDLGHGEPLYRVRAEPSLPTIGCKEKGPMYSTPVPSSGSRPTSSQSHSKSQHQSRRKVAHDLVAGVRIRESSTSPKQKYGRISHEKLVRSPDWGRTSKTPHSPSPTSGSSTHTVNSLGHPTMLGFRRASRSKTPRSASPANSSGHGKFISNLPGCQRGVDIVVLAFGEPGTGKTYTLSGLNGSYNNRGLIPRALDEVLGKMRPRGYDFKTSVSYVEFWENRCYDLLSPGKKPVEVEPRKIKPIEVQSPIEALDLLFRGEVKRKFEKANFNCGSSVFTIHIRSQPSRADGPYTSFSKIHFVDAPGIETLWESNKSDPCAISANLEKLSVDVTSRWAYYLSRAIAKPSKAKSMAVYGTSGLISYLERSFTHGFVALLGTIRPNGDKLRNTLSTLRFGCKVARLHTGLLERHQQPSPAHKTAILKNDIDNLKAQIETRKLLSFGEYDRFNVCQGEAQHIERLVRSYIKTDFPNSISETCLLSTARPELLLEEIRRQYQAECYFITSYFRKKSIDLVPYKNSSNFPVSDASKKTSNIKKRRARGSAVSESQTFDSNLFKEAAEKGHAKEDGVSMKSKSKSIKSVSRKSQASSRKSMGPRKSKAGGARPSKALKGKGKGIKVASAAKPEPIPSPIDKEFLDKGRKDRVWLMNEFLLRNKEVADEKNASESFFERARDAKVSKAKDLDEYRASLGRSRIMLDQLQFKKNHMTVGGAAATSIAEEEKTFLDKEKEAREKIAKAVEELAELNDMLSVAKHMHDTFMKILQARFNGWIEEIYEDERYQGEPEYMSARQLDKEIPRQTVSPSIRRETEAEVDFLKLQESFFRKKLPIMPIIHEGQ